MNKLDLKLAFFKKAYSVAYDICAFCKTDLSSIVFNDWESIDESLISSLCQNCQDETFKEVSYE